MLRNHSKIIKQLVTRSWYHIHNNKPLDLAKGRSLIQNNAYFKAKPQQPKGKKPAGKQQQKPVVQQPSKQIDGFAFLKPRGNCVSPQQLKYLKQGFEDISQSDRKLLDQLAEQILRIKSSTFFKLVQDGGLGTEDSLYVRQRELSQTEIKQGVLELRKGS